MEIKIVCNASSRQEGLSLGWGLSFLIDNRIIFDTGEKGKDFLNNMKKLNINLFNIEAVALSHDHWDHVGGLWQLLEKSPGLKVCACPGFSGDFKEKVRCGGGNLVENSKWYKVAENIYLTGEIEGMYKDSFIAEQATVLETSNGLTVITGCAHPGILKILKVVRHKFPQKKLYAVMGGFHLLHQNPRDNNILVNKFKGLGIKKVGPTHCSGEAAENAFEEVYLNDFLTMKAGEVIIV